LCKPGALISSRNLPGGEPVIDVCFFVANGMPVSYHFVGVNKMLYRSTVIVISSPAKNARSTAL
jgi:hypothetical protein